MAEVNLPWNDYNDVELANNELVSLFTMNRCLRRLLDNDKAFKGYISSPLSAINFASDDDMTPDADEDGKATTPAIIAHYLHGETADGAITHDITMSNDSVYKAPSIPSVKTYFTNLFNTYDLDDNGYYKLPGGLLIQWGNVTSYYNEFTVTFPTAFTECYNVIMNIYDKSASAEYTDYQIHDVTTINFTVRKSDVSYGRNPALILPETDERFYWFAIGKV